MKINIVTHSSFIWYMFFRFLMILMKYTIDTICCNLQSSPKQWNIREKLSMYFMDKMKNFMDSMSHWCFQWNTMDKMSTLWMWWNTIDRMSTSWKQWNTIGKWVCGGVWGRSGREGRVGRKGRKGGCCKVEWGCVSMSIAWHLRRIYFWLLLEESSFKRRMPVRQTNF